MAVRGGYNLLLYLRFWICLVREFLFLSGNSQEVSKRDVYGNLVIIQSFKVFFFLDR